MSTTITLTENNLVLHLHNPQPRRDAFEGLVNIYETYSAWDDSRSEAILDWIEGVADVNNFTEAFQRNPAEHLARLVSICVDQFFPQMRLQRPVLVQETGWVCEGLFFRAYVPREGEPRFTTVPHEFIQAVYRWIHDSTGSGAQVVVRGDGPDPDEEQIRTNPLGRMILVAYPAMIRTTLMNETLVRQTEEARRATEALTAQEEQIRIDTAAQIQESEERSRERLANLHARLEAGEQAQADLTRRLAEVNAEQRAAIEANSVEIEDLRRQNDRQTQENKNLRQEIEQERQRVNACLGKKKRKKFLGLF